MNYAGDGISFLNLRFENDVIWYGTQTRTLNYYRLILFENDVIWYGTQTINNHTGRGRGLRMM